MRSFLLLFLLGIFTMNGLAQDLKGRDFWFSFPPNNETNYDSPGASYYIYLLSDYCTEGTVSIPELNFSTDFTGDPGTYVEILLPNTTGGQSILHTTANTVQGKGIHIVSDYPVAAFAVNYQQASVDGEAIIPTRWLGTKYVPVIRSYSSNSPTRVTIVATEDNTNVEIKTWTNAGVPITRNTTLNTGQTYMYNTTRNNCGGDNNTGYDTHCRALTASVIESDKPIAVMGGNDCSNLLVCGACDVLMTMMLPEDRWGDEYVTGQPVKRLAAQNLACLPGALNISIKSMADMLEIVGPVGTNVSIQNLDGTTNLTIPAPPYDNGANYGYGYLWYENPPSGGAFDPEGNGEANTIITSDNPIEIVQYGKGWQTDGQNFTDPESIILYPIDTWESSYLAATLRTPTTVLSEAILIVKDEGNPSPTTTMLQDGAAVAGAWQDIADGTFKFVRVTTSMIATTRFENTSGAKFGLYQTARSAAESYSITGAFGGLLEESCPGCPVADFIVDDACEGNDITINNVSIDPKFNITEYKWIFGDGDTLVTTTSTNPNHTYASAGVYTIELIVTNDATPICSDTLMVPVTVVPSPIVNAGPDQQICREDSVWIGNTNPVIGNNPPYIFSWNPTSGLNFSDSTRAFVYPSSTTKYAFEAEDQLGCVGSDTVEVVVADIEEIRMKVHPDLCANSSTSIEFDYTGTDPVKLVVRDSDNNEYTVNDVLGGETVVTTISDTTQFWIKSANLTSGAGCLKVHDDTITINVLPRPDGELLSDMTICSNMDSSLTFALSGIAPYQVFYSTSAGDNLSLTANTDSTDLAISNLDTTTQYTLDSIAYPSFAGCTSYPNKSVTVTVNTLPEAGDDTELDLCANTGVFDLFAELESGSDPNSGGNWEDLDGSGGLSGNTITTTVIAEGAYNFRYIVDGVAPCPSDSSVMTINIKSAPQFDPQVETCLPSEQFYEVNSTVTGGDPSSYAVSGGGTITGSAFNSGPIPTGQPYQYIVSDAFGCGEDTIAGIKACACRTDAGTMDVTPQEYCEGQDIDLTGFYNNDFVDDGDDRYIFVLHDNAGPSLGNILQQNTTAPVFTYDPALLVKTYYVSPVAGNISGSSIDMNDICLSVGPGTPIQFFALPQASFGPDTNICLGGTAQIPVSFVGFQPFGIVSSLGDTIGNLSATDKLDFSPLGDTTIQFVSVFTNRCSNAIDHTISIEVFNSPSITLSGFDTLCYDDLGNLVLDFEVSGDGNQFEATLEHSGPNGKDTTVFSNLAAGNHSKSILFPPVGANTYRGIDVTDNSGGSCPGFAIGSKSVFVKPIPTLDFTLDETGLCLGEDQYIHFSITPANQSYSVTYLDALTGVSNVLTGVTNGSSFKIPTTTPGDHSISITSFFDEENGPACDGRVNTAATDFIVNDAPTLSVSGRNQYCEDENLISVDIAFSGFPPFEFNVERNGIAAGAFNLTASGDTTITIPNVVGTHQIYGSYLADQSSGGCPGIGVDTLDVFVAPTPTVSFPSPIELCAGDALSLSIGVTGNGPITVQLEDEDGNTYQDSDLDGDGFINFSLPVFADSTWFAFTQISDNSNPNTCVAPLGDTLIVDVNPLPTGDLRVQSGSEDLCIGSSANIEIDISGTERATAYYTNLSTGESSSRTITDASGYRSLTISNLVEGWNYFVLDSLESKAGAECVNYIGDMDSLYVHPLPDLQLNVLDDVLCFGEDLVYEIVATGSIPIEFTTNLDPGTVLTINPGDTLQFSQVATDVDEVRIGDIAYASAPFCAQAFDPTKHLAAIVVNTLPTADMTLSSERLCAGEELRINLLATGTPDFLFIVERNGVLFDSISSPTIVTNMVLDNSEPGDFTYVLTLVEDGNGCVGRLNDSAFVESLPAPETDFSLPVFNGCPPLATTMVNLTVDDYVSCLWNFGDGTQSTGSCNSIDHYYISPGIYDVSLTVTNDVGCAGTKTMADTIEVFESPIPEFHFTPSSPSIKNPLVNFINTSSFNDHNAWYLDGNLFSQETNPMYEFPVEDEAEYTIQLVATTENGCTDSTSKVLAVDGVMLVNIPTAFSPDGDGLNDVFIPIILGYDEEITEYDFTVFDRWGIPVFHTRDIHQGWDGKDLRGEYSPIGHYVYQIAVRSKYDATKEKYTGSVHLIR